MQAVVGRGTEAYSALALDGAEIQPKPFDLACGRRIPGRPGHAPAAVTGPSSAILAGVHTEPIGQHTPRQCDTGHIDNGGQHKAVCLLNGRTDSARGWTDYPIGASCQT